MDIEVTTPPANQSVSLDLLKAQKRIRNTSEDELIDFYLMSADEHLEKEANIAVMEQTIVYRIPRVLKEIVLPRPPLINVTSLKHYDESDVETNVDVGTLIKRTENGLALIKIPSITTNSCGYMEVEYTAGHSEGTDVPHSLRQAVMLLAAHWYTSREAAFLDPRVLNVDKKISFGVDQLIQKFKVPNVHELNAG